MDRGRKRPHRPSWPGGHAQSIVAARGIMVAVKVQDIQCVPAWPVAAAFLLLCAWGCSDNSAGSVDGQTYITLDKTEITLKYLSGAPECPGPQDQISFTNISAAAILWDISGAPSWLRLQMDNGLTQAKSSTTINMLYDCGQYWPGVRKATLYLTVADPATGAVRGTARIEVTAIVE